MQLTRSEAEKIIRTEVEKEFKKGFRSDEFDKQVHRIVSKSFRQFMELMWTQRNFIKV